MSIWLADFGRQRLRDEGWAGLVTGRHVVGAITNPTIFATAITGSGAYEEELRDLALLNVEVDEATHGVDGRVHYLSRIDERPCRPRWPRNPRERPWTACISSSTLRPHNFRERGHFRSALRQMQGGSAILPRMSTAATPTQ